MKKSVCMLSKMKTYDGKKQSKGKKQKSSKVIVLREREGERESELVGTSVRCQTV